jgi:hypothetical protein
MSIWLIFESKFGPGEVWKHYIAAQHLAASLLTFVSVDEALHFYSDHPIVVALGKLEIVRQILKAERESPLFRTQGGVSMAANTWLGEFLSMALANLKMDEAVNAFSNITMINFNYDRVVEHFLYEALHEALVSLNSDKRLDIAKQAFSKMKVIRPYGSVGELGWQNNQHGHRFGGTSTDIFEQSKKLRTYIEQHTTCLKSEIAAAIDKAALIIVIGFGYHDQNMKLFELPNGRSRPPNTKQKRNLFATVHGIAGGNHRLIQSRLQSLMNPDELSVTEHAAAQLLAELRLPILAAAN